jgi:hypothetical protein
VHFVPRPETSIISIESKESGEPLIKKYNRVIFLGVSPRKVFQFSSEKAILKCYLTN